MTSDEILNVCTHALRDILLDDSIVLTPQTEREDVPNWDSLNYILFIVAIENKLGIKFRVADVESFQNVGAIVARASALLQAS